MKRIKPESVMRAPWRYDTAPFCIADNLYYVGNTTVSSHLIDTGGGRTIVPTEWDRFLNKILKTTWRNAHNGRDHV